MYWEGCWSDHNGVPRLPYPQKLRFQECHLVPADSEIGSIAARASGLPSGLPAPSPEGTFLACLSQLPGGLSLLLRQVGTVVKGGEERTWKVLGSLERARSIQPAPSSLGTKAPSSLV